MLGDDPVELGLKGREQEFLNIVSRDPVYRRHFPVAFPGGIAPVFFGRSTSSIARLRAW